MIGASLGGMEPNRGVAAGQHILLDAECRNEKAVDHVLRSHDQLDIASHWNVQFVDLARAFLMLQLPHPLLGHNINLGGVSRGSALLKINHRTPSEDKKKNEHGDDGPGNLRSEEHT